ncbi:MAG: antitoxin component YwqK of YwqJK toxin-antitoxin module [Candidatus Pelagisphaera sp.]|jgi:antitoxin component YwqK of YwqJK toxin-antitoxin module
MKPFYPIITAIFASFVTPMLMSAPENKVFTKIEYFDKEKTKPVYEWSFYMKDGEEVLHGTDTFWFENGTIEGESEYVHGKQNGLNVWYYENGNIKSRCIYDMNRLIHGKYFHHNEQLACEVNDGNGQWKEFDEATGEKLVYIASYLNGLKNGTETNYDDQGVPYSTRQWDHGILKSEKN